MGGSGGSGMVVLNIYKGTVATTPTGQPTFRPSMPTSQPTQVNDIPTLTLSPLRQSKSGHDGSLDHPPPTLPLTPTVPRSLLYHHHHHSGHRGNRP